MPKFFYSLFCLNFLLALALAASASWALESDRQLAIEITAQQMSWNNQQQQATYTGKVEASQGELLILADQLQLTRNQQGQLKQALATNKQGQAYMRDLPQQDEPIIEAWGQSLNFLAEQNLIVITGKAKLTQGKDSFTGHQLTYNLVTQAIKAEQQPNTSERVKVIFTPKEQPKN